MPNIAEILNIYTNHTIQIAHGKSYIK